MRGYAQFCALAKALDVLGDRWTLLIIRELMIRDACRFTDIRNGLPGIASNLLTDRLRDLESAGLVERETMPPPIASTLYRLTSSGNSVQPVIEALGSFGARLLGAPRKGESFQSHWLCLPLSIELIDKEPKARPVTVQVVTGNEPFVLRTHDGRVRAQPGTVRSPDATIAGAPDIVMKFLLGRLEAAPARKQGLKLEGDLAAIARIRRSNAKALASGKTALNHKQR